MVYHTPSASAGTQTQDDILFRSMTAATTTRTRIAIAAHGACATASRNMATISSSADPMTSLTRARRNE